MSLDRKTCVVDFLESLKMSDKMSFRRPRPEGKARRVRLSVECLEDRFVPSGGPRGSGALAPSPNHDVAAQVVLQGTNVSQSDADTNQDSVHLSGSQQPAGKQGGGGPTMVTISGPGYPQVPVAGPARSTKIGRAHV